jgi:two-component system alkaline phosphatase synthesis response regulator PhoP
VGVVPIIFGEMHSYTNSGSVEQLKRILVIDDDPDITITLQAALEKYGFKVDYYTNPVSAYKNFREGLYDLVILDIKMPEFDGFLLYQKIKKKDSNVKICFLTAGEFYYEQFRKEHAFNELKQESFLRKPIENEELVHTIKKLLESR